MREARNAGVLGCIFEARSEGQAIRRVPWFAEVQRRPCPVCKQVISGTNATTNRRTRCPSRPDAGVDHPHSFADSPEHIRQAAAWVFSRNRRLHSSFRSFYGPHLFPDRRARRQRRDVAEVMDTNWKAVLLPTVALGV